MSLPSSGPIEPEGSKIGGFFRKAFGKCANCGTLSAGGRKEGDLRFCSKVCHQFYLQPGFCDACAAETTEGNIGGTYTLNVLFGTRLMSFSKSCTVCHSAVTRKWFWFVLPLFPVSAKYRVLYQKPQTYISRKMNAN
jgi:hypothetical protein